MEVGGLEGLMGAAVECLWIWIGVWIYGGFFGFFASGKRRVVDLAHGQFVEPDTADSMLQR